MISFDYEHLKDIVAKHVLPLLENHRILIFSGPLGVGKTALIKEILKQSDVSDIVDSPTFGYVKSYKTPSGLVFNHFDLYRIGSLDGFVDAGFDEYLNRKNEYCLIEWPDVIEPLLSSPNLQNNVHHIELMYQPKGLSDQRFIKFFKKH